MSMGSKFFKQPAAELRVQESLSGKVQNMPAKPISILSSKFDSIKHKNIVNKSTLLRVATPEDTASCMQSDRSKNIDQFSDNILFRLVYLPVHLSEKEVVKKLSKFGTVIDFNFVPVTPEEIYLDEKKSANFQCVEFRFKEKEVKDSFSQVKRIRIKGLQVRVIQKSPEETFAKETSSMSQALHPRVLHNCRPTTKAYFGHRSGQSSTLLQSPENNYYWRKLVSRE